MNIAGKIWGSTSELFNKNNVEIHRIEIKEGAYCSIHKHEHKFNMFFVESGELLVKVWKNDYNLIDQTTLKKSDSTTVSPGEFHQFLAIKDTVAYEIYWTEIQLNDIIRKDCGGNTNEQN